MKNGNKTIIDIIKSWSKKTFDAKLLEQWKHEGSAFHIEGNGLSQLFETEEKKTQQISDTNVESSYYSYKKVKLGKYFIYLT